MEGREVKKGGSKREIEHVNKLHAHQGLPTLSIFSPFRQFLLVLISLFFLFCSSRCAPKSPLPLPGSMKEGMKGKGKEKAKLLEEIPDGAEAGSSNKGMKKREEKAKIKEK